MIYDLIKKKSNCKFDFVGFGALNIDTFCKLLPNKKIENVLPDLKPGSERIGTEDDRKELIKNIAKSAKVTCQSGGGQAANTAVALARMGFKCGFIGKVGNDRLGDMLLESLENVDKSHIQRGDNSGECLCIIDQEGERANIVFPGCNDTIFLDNSDIDYVKESKVLYLTSFCNENILQLQNRLIEQIPNETLIAFDPGEIYSRFGVNRLSGILHYTDILFATTEELNIMTGKEPIESAEYIIRNGVDMVICKMAEKGSKIITKDRVIEIAITRVNKVVDKTGAGDVYSAGFIAGLLLELPLELCGKMASEASALSITGYGRSKYPDKEFVNKFLQNLRCETKMNESNKH